MKRAGGLFERVVERENLRLAFYRARSGKAWRSDVLEFAADLDVNLRHMAEGLESGVFPVGEYCQFTIHDPKRRTITAPCFAERVLHHAIMNVCEPNFERFLIADTFACRAGKGRIAALHRAVRFSKLSPMVLKLDMRKYFDSISHKILMDRLSWRFKDKALLRLFNRIIASHGGATGKGLPIGSLTSQHFANFYLGWFDRFVKEALGVRGYVRYMDDCALWGSGKESLRTIETASRAFLKTELDLEPKSDSPIETARRGFDFLGCRVYPDHLKLNRRSRRRFRRKLIDLEEAFIEDRLSELELQRRAEALISFTQAGGTKSWRFRSEMLQSLRVSGQWARTG